MSGFNFEDFAKKLDEKFATNPVVKPIVDATKQRTAFVVLGLGAVIALIIVAVFGLEFLSNSFGLLPIFTSVKAAKTPGADTKQWLTYWIVFSLVMVAESFVDEVLDDDDDDDDDDDTLLELVYYVAKIAFLYWAGSSEFRGAEKIYDKALEPVFAKLEPLVSKKA